jgi:hypothetical protein
MLAAVKVAAALLVIFVFPNCILMEAIYVSNVTEAVKQKIGG